MSNWWANKLGTPPAPPRQAPPTGPGHPQQRAYQPPPPVGAPQEQRYQEQPPAEDEPQLGPGEVDAGTAMRAWKGTAAAQAHGNCPACGSPRYFSALGSSVVNQNSGTPAQHAGHCFDCGYPNEQGSLAGDVSKVIGGANSARQGEMPPVNMIPGRTQ